MRNLLIGLTAIVLVAVPLDAASAQGIAISGIGAVNLAMGGAATAAPIDAAGALHWNPATISGLSSSEVNFGFGLVLPSERVSSRLPAGAFGGFPLVPLQGTDTGEPGASPLPNIAFVEKSEVSAWTYGLGVAAIGGFRTNYPASSTNPILTPQPPNGFGLGSALSEAELFQIAPTLSYAFTDSFSVGFAPTLTMARLTVDPLLVAQPDDADQNGFASYPSGRGNRWIYGGGFQIGMYYIANHDWRFGAAIKSKQWFEKARFKTTDELGRPSGTREFGFEYPFILSTGISYNGFERSIIAADFRFFDYANARGFRDTGFDSNAALRGLGWRSIFAMGCGIQHQLTDRFWVRTGYSYNQNPIEDALAGFNVLSPTISQNFIYLGSTYQFSRTSAFSLAYTHAFKNSISGEIQTPVGPIPGSNVTSEVSLDAISATIAVKY